MHCQCLVTLSLPKKRCTIINITYQHTLSLKKAQEECVLTTNQLAFTCVFKLTLTIRLIHSIVTLGHPDDHFHDGFQTKQAVSSPNSLPISLAQNTAAQHGYLSMHNTANYVTAAYGFVGCPLNGFTNPLAPLSAIVLILSCTRGSTVNV